MSALDCLPEGAGKDGELHRGRCLLDFDWKYKNAIGIKTADEQRAREWLIWAIMLDYSPTLQWGRYFVNSKSSVGIKSIRRLMRDQQGIFWRPSADLKQKCPG